MDVLSGIWKEILGISCLTLVIFTLLNYQEFKEILLSYWNSTSANFDYLTDMLNKQDKPPPKEEKVAGVGSIWNNNNWFYEEKNYSSFAKSYLKEELK